MKKIALIAIALLLGNILLAQQDAQYTQYMYNTISVNPAYAGTRGHFSALLLHRSQWVGLDGAPTTQTLSLHSPLSNGKIGLGLSVVNDKIGPSNEVYLDIDFSYTIPVNGEGAKLSFGLKAGGNFLSVDFNDPIYFNPGDPNFGNNLNGKFFPNIGAGAYYHTNKFYAGLSVPNFLESDHFDEEIRSTASERMTFYMISGYVFELSENVKFKPAVLGKITSGTPLQLDISANFLLGEKFTLGAAYRWDAAISGMAGFQISDKLMIGYAYDGDVTNLSEFNSGSHEVFLRFELFSKKGGMVTPRFF